MPFGGEHGPIYDSGDMVAGLDAFHDRADVDGIREQVLRRRQQGELVGLGTAFAMEHSGNGKHESVVATLDHDGVVTLGTGAAEVGQGVIDTVLRVAADRVGIATSALRVVAGDSRGHREGRGTFGSRTTIFVGSAVADAGGRLRSEAIRRAADKLGVPTAQIVVGPQTLRGGTGEVAWKDLAPIHVEGVHEMADATWGFGAYLAVVAVDPVSAVPAVERLSVAYDCGVAIDPDNVHRQLVGGAVHGLGGALHEELAYAPDGQPLATTLMDYAIPTSAEVPDVEAFVLELEPASGNPLGVKGAGEAGVIGGRCRRRQRGRRCTRPPGRHLVPARAPPEVFRAFDTTALDRQEIP